MKIVVLDGHTENPGDLSWEGFSRQGDLTVYDLTDPRDESLIQARIGDAEIILVNKTPISAATVAACPQLRYVGVLATGYDVVDVKAARAGGITVTNIPAYGTETVAQFAMALLLEICNRVGHHAEAVKQGRWAEAGEFCFWDYPLMELAGKTMGIIGYGRIGRSTGKLAHAFGMEVLACDAFPVKDLEEYARAVSLEKLYAEADVIALHCNLTPENRGMINKDSISRMKNGVIILNNSRGPLINEPDLAAALNSGKVYAAGLDVVTVEPVRPDNPLLAAKNCIITPHISWATKESRQRLMDIAVRNLERCLSGQPENTV
ncbi:MAG: D-2-hydroxyacid dehydrogenase [Gracilibacteraceae bacterium]|jgi:glycerate dehydrogenase|nr:D-2-hydroxyacid dehydrogenase [Gracilibacteraceae bacterium]